MIEFYLKKGLGTMKYLVKWGKCILSSIKNPRNTDQRKNWSIRYDIEMKEKQFHSVIL